jgi:hypothetical protein
MRGFKYSLVCAWMHLLVPACVCVYVRAGDEKERAAGGGGVIYKINGFFRGVGPGRLGGRQGVGGEQQAQDGPLELGEVQPARHAAVSRPEHTRGRGV